MTKVLRPIEIGRTIHELVNSARFNAIRMTTRELASIEDWHLIGAPGEAAFEDGWSNVGEPTLNELSYFRDTGKVVHWRGYIRNMAPPASHGNWSRVCHVPQEWWPEHRTYLWSFSRFSVDGGAHWLGGRPFIMCYQGDVMIQAVEHSQGFARQLSYDFIVLDNRWYWTA